MRTLHLAASGNATQIATNVSAAPAAPYTDDLVALPAASGERTPWGLIQIMRNTSAPVLTGPVRVIGECDGRIVELAELKQGGQIAPTADLGFQELVFGVGLCSKVAIVPASVAGGSYDAFYCPVAESA